MERFFHRGRLSELEHDKLVRKLLDKGLDQLLTRHNLVKDGKVTTNAPILGLPELRWAEPGKEGKLGIGKPGKDGDPIPLSGEGAGGDHHSGAQTIEIDFDELIRFAQENMLEDFELPIFRKPGMVLNESPDSDQMELDRQGLPGDMDLERTMLESLERSVREGGELEYDVDPRKDGWYREDTPDRDNKSQALEVYCLDISGSVSGTWIGMIRKLIFLIWYYLDKHYKHNVRRYVIFQDQAEEVERDKFFSIESVGGTHISNGLKACLDCLRDYQSFDKYLFLFTDGDASESDSIEATNQLKACIESFDRVVYGIMNPKSDPFSYVSTFNTRALALTIPHKFSMVDLKESAPMKVLAMLFLAGL